MSAFAYRHGPDIRADGVVFRLWAPEARSVAVELEGVTHRMHPAGDGWMYSDPLPAEIGARYAFRVNDDILVPDPASRQQEDDVHGRSVLCGAFRKAAPDGWSNRSWPETVLYELHIGTFTSAGTFNGVTAELPRLKEIGITAVELMPVADFPGRWNWGYDGVLPFAADRRYGTRDDLHQLVESTHRHNLALWLDVVYNHFGPEGNYLHLYAPQFFSDSIDTPWGPGIDFTRPEVRQFFIENAVYWTRELGIDGLRLDAVHAIEDPSERNGGVHILEELAATVRRAAPDGKAVHLVLENDKNQARFLSPADPEDPTEAPEENYSSRYSGQWNDDIHHAFHILLTGETFGYYGDYADQPEHHLIRALAEGYVYQGEVSPGTGTPRGETSTHLSPTRFIAFLQNHDQIGNRAWGERLRSLAPPEALDAAITALLLSPQTPLIFMGEEVGTEAPFQFFCDFDAELADAVRTGRRREFGLEDIPDPIAKATVDASVPDRYAENRWTALYRTLLTIRRRELVPLLPRMRAGTYTEIPDTAPVVTWDATDTRWCLAVNLSDTPRALPVSPNGVAVYPAAALPVGRIPEWTTVVWKETSV